VLGVCNLVLGRKGTTEGYSALRGDIRR